MPQITVIVPVYKVEPYIHECVDSILSQSFQDFDLVLVDDGSPDSCPQICDAYAEKDPRITVIHKQNGGLSDARNAGIDWAMEHSDSEWLAFVDSDDYLHPDYLRILYETAQKESADLVVCDFIRVNDQKEIVEKKHNFFDLVTEDKKKLFNMMCNNWRIIPAWNKLYDKHIFDELRFAFGKIHEDDFAIPHVLWNCRRAAFLPNELLFYRIRKNSIMATETPKSKLDEFEALIDRYEFGLSHQLLTLKKIPTDYLHRYASLKQNLADEERKRLARLMKRFSGLFFSDPSNRNIKRFLALRFSTQYRKASVLLNKVKSATRGKES